MQPDMRNPRVGDKVVLHANRFPDQPEPLDGEVVDINIDRSKFYVVGANKKAKWLSADDFNLNPNSVR